MKKLRRRRVLSIAAAAAVVPRWVSAATPVRWEGAALGTRATIVLHHPDETIAGEAIRQSVAEIERLERIFSLYRNDSALSRLNRNGALTDPPPDLVRLLSEAIAFSRLTNGAFDVTVQPLWELHATHFQTAHADPKGPAPALVAAARQLVDYRAIVIDPHETRLSRAGMGVTLNGIAQGYIADRVADLLRGFGFENALIDMGETVALGPKPNGAPWQVGVADPAHPGKLLRRMELETGAVATSAPSGTVFDRTGRLHHLFDARSGRSANGFASVTVQDRSATRADALSTAIAVSAGTELESLIAAARPEKVFAADAEGRLFSWPSS